MRTHTTSATRRRLLRASLAAPVALAALSITPAFADDGDHDDGDDHHQPPHAPHAALEPFSSDLVTVAQSASSGDFTSANPGADPLTDGHIAMRRRPDNTVEGRAAVSLRGAAANVSYDVFFQPFNTAKGREGLGTVGPTNDHGDLNKQTPNLLSGLNRVGIFIIARTGDGSAQAGKDQFVTSLGG